MDWFRSLMLPPQGSAFAGEVDTLYMFLFWLRLFCSWGSRSRRFISRTATATSPGRVTPHITHNTCSKSSGACLPLLLCVVIFFWGLNG